MLRSLMAWLRDRRAQARAVTQLLERAEQLAREEGLQHPGGEHLLLAACDLPDGTASDALARVGIDRHELASALRETHRQALDALGLRVDDDAVATALPAPRPPAGVYRSEGSLQDMLRRTHDLVQESGTGFCGAWVVAAATDQERGTVARALQQLGVRREELRQAARATARRNDAAA